MLNVNVVAGLSGPPCYVATRAFRRVPRGGGSYAMWASDCELPEVDPCLDVARIAIEQPVFPAVGALLKGKLCMVGTHIVNDDLVSKQRREGEGEQHLIDY